MFEAGCEFISEVPEIECELGLEGAIAALEAELLSEEEAIRAGLVPAAYRGEPGKSPRIGEDGCWEIYDETGGEWRSTGISARGAVDYGELSNKPRINGVELVGDRSARQLGLENRITNAQIEALFKEEDASWH